MGYPLRWNRPDLVYEVSISTIQGRYLLRPSLEVRDLILGVLSRALERYRSVKLYGFVFGRDQASLLLSASDEQELSPFMAYLEGNTARKLGRLLDWSGKLWAGRFRAVPVLDEEAIAQRLRHVLSLGVAEGLVESPRAWPGASAVPALLGTMTLEGAWVDRDREAHLRSQGLDPPPSAYVRSYRVEMTPLPSWAHLPPAELRSRYQEMVASIESEHRAKRVRPVLDPVELQRQDPFFRPPTRRPLRQRLRELCHATSNEVAEAFRTAYRAFCATFRAAASALGLQHDDQRALVAAFPPGSYPRPNLAVPAAPPKDDGTAAGPDPAETVRDEALTNPGVDDLTTPWLRPGGRQAPRLRHPVPWFPGAQVIDLRDPPPPPLARDRARRADQRTRMLAPPRARATRAGA